MKGTVQEKSKLKTNPKFLAVRPKLRAELYAELENSVRDKGIKQKLVVWKNTLLDGHKRYELAQKYNLGYKLEEKDFSNESEALLWVIENQLKRTDLTNLDKLTLCGAWIQTYDTDARHKLQRGIENANGKYKYIAHKAGIGINKVQNHMNIIRNGSDEIKQHYLSGELSYKDALNTVQRKKKTTKFVEQAQKESSSKTRRPTKKGSVEPLIQMLLPQLDGYDASSSYHITCSEEDLLNTLKSDNLSIFEKNLIGFCLLELRSSGLGSGKASQVGIAKEVGVSDSTLVKFVNVMYRANKADKEAVLLGQVAFSTAYNNLDPMTPHRNKGYDINKLRQMRAEAVVGKHSGAMTACSSELDDLAFLTEQRCERILAELPKLTNQEKDELKKGLAKVVAYLTQVTTEIIK